MSGNLGTHLTTLVNFTNASNKDGMLHRHVAQWHHPLTYAIHIICNLCNCPEPLEPRETCRRLCREEVVYGAVWIPSLFWFILLHTNHRCNYSPFFPMVPLGRCKAALIDDKVPISICTIRSGINQVVVLNYTALLCQQFHDYGTQEKKPRGKTAWQWHF